MTDKLDFWVILMPFYKMPARGFIQSGQRIGLQGDQKIGIKFAQNFGQNSQNSC
jgi:hypothetical protein